MGFRKDQNGFQNKGLSEAEPSHSALASKNDYLYTFKSHFVYEL